MAGPFQVVKNTWTVKPKGRKPPPPGAKIRVENVRLEPVGDAAELRALVNGIGILDLDKDGLAEQNTISTNMWLSAWVPGMSLEFEFPEPVWLSTMELWNYNADWRASNGIAKADVAVSLDGSSWKTVQKGFRLSEADGTGDYDEPSVMKFSSVRALKVRLSNLIPLSASGRIGLSEVVFREASNPQASPLMPEDGAVGVAYEMPKLEWVRGWTAVEHVLYLGTNPSSLEKIGTTKDTHAIAPTLKPGTRYYWRVDEVLKNGKVTAGRVGRFDTGLTPKGIGSRAMSSM